MRRHDDNDAPRKKITLDTTKTAGHVTLTCSNAKVKVFTAASEGIEITFDGTDNKFAVADLPKDLYVQGHEASDSMRDVTLTLTHNDNDSDAVKFTVLWVTVTSKHSGTISGDNDKKQTATNLWSPPTDQLGLHFGSLFNLGGSYPGVGSMMWGRASEFKGEVKPSNFDPTQFSSSLGLKLVRWLDQDSWYLREPGEDPYDHSRNDEDDTSQDHFRDDDPSPNGNIYDYDPPGSPINPVWGVGAVWRKRANYRQWAAYGQTRCSNIVAWYTRTSMKKLSAAVTKEVTSATTTTITDNTQSWTTNEWTPGAIEIRETDEVRNVSGNTATTITVAQAWNTLPQQGDHYILLKKSAWAEDTTYPPDNQNGDGTTSVEIDLS